MKGLSLTQPWATLVAIGAKRIETRSWSTPYRGELLIQAAKGFPKDCAMQAAERPFRDVLEAAGVKFRASTPQHWYHVADYRYVSGLPLGAIVAVARLTGVSRTEDIVQMSQGLLQHEIEFGNYDKGRFGFVLADVKPLRHPIPCKGALGLWSVPQVVLDLIAGQGVL